MKELTVLQVLKDARALITNPRNWTTGDAARDKRGARVEVGDYAAVRFCSIGAIRKAGSDNVKAEHAAMDKLYELLPEDIGIAWFNDRYTHSEVLALFDRAIEKEKVNHVRQD